MLHTTKLGFLESLGNSGLLSDDQIQAFIAKLSQPDVLQAPEQLAKAFVRGRLLTRFQARQLLAGRWRGLAFGDYRVLDSLSCGGMGEVFLAERMSDHSPVAIKVLRSRFRDQPAVVQRFQLECQLLTTLRHPHLLQGLDAATFDDGHVRFRYLVTEFVKGPNLYEWVLLKRRIPWPQAAEIVRQASEGLHHAHAAGYAHRDVKPGNLLLSPEGTVRVIDFGLVKKLGVTGQAAASTADDTAQSAEATLESPSVVGLAVTESDDQLFALDIDGLGAALCYALTGRNDHLDGRVVALQKYRPDLPAGMLDVVRRTELRQADRFHTAEQLAQALRPYCESFRVEVDYPSLLTARNRARRQQAQADLELVQAEERPLTSVASPVASPVAETSSGTIARPDASFAELQAIIPTPVNEQTPQTVSVEFAKLEQLLGGVIQKVDARREQDLGILSQLATLKRAQAEEQVRLIGELQVLRATVEQEQQATAQLKEELEQARRKAAADREYYEQQLGVLANDLQRAHANEQRLVAELATTNEQLAIAKTQAERLAVQLHQASEQADPRNPAQMFWLAYEQACRTDEPSTLADLYYDSLSEELP